MKKEASRADLIPVFLTVLEVAQTLKTSRTYIYRQIKNGRLSAYRIGNQLRIAETDLQTFLSQQRAQSTALPKAQHRHF